MPAPLFHVGGQTVIEGVLMRAPGSFAVAVRRPTGEIVVRERPWRSWAERSPMLRMPVIRGVSALLEGVAAALEGLSFAAGQAGLGGDLAPAAIDTIGIAPDSKRRLGSLLLSLAIASLFGASLFIALPHVMAVALARLVGGLPVQSVAFQVLAGVCKLVVFIVYLQVLGWLPDIKRLFMYHGAEHKVISAFEAGASLDVVTARRYDMRHGRCGTSFVLMLVLLGIGLLAIVFPLLPWLGHGWRGHAVAIGLKIPLMVPVTGLAYELNRWAAKNMQRRLVRWLMAPGFWLQRLTVREPSDDMLEVALVALKASLSRGRRAVVPARTESTLVYQSFADVCARQV